MLASSCFSILKMRAREISSRYDRDRRDINTASGVRIHQNKKGIFIVLLFSSRMIFIYGKVFSLMSEWPRKNQGKRKERDRNVIKMLEINSRYTVPKTERRKHAIAESLSLCKCVFFLHAKPVSRLIFDRHFTVCLDT